MQTDIEKEWNRVLPKLENIFGGDLNIQGILFLIGVQELGKGPKSYSKSEKMDVIHVAICTILEPYGYYKFLGEDEDGWLHFDTEKAMPKMTPSQQLKLMKQGIIDYLDRIDL
jgi:hypothetical protein